MTDPIAKRLAELHAETYAQWVLRFCQNRNIPWRDEYATPIEDGAKPKEGKRNAE